MICMFKVVPYYKLYLRAFKINTLRFGMLLMVGNSIRLGIYNSIKQYAET